MMCLFSIGMMTKSIYNLVNKEMPFNVRNYISTIPYSFHQKLTPLRARATGGHGPPTFLQRNFFFNFPWLIFEFCHISGSNQSKMGPFLSKSEGQNWKIFPILIAAIYSFLHFEFSLKASFFQLNGKWGSTKNHFYWVALGRLFTRVEGRLFS